MMQLICNGVQLDLYEDAGLQFAHNNPLFAFDSIACERTTQFKLPTTPTNDRVLALARIPAYVGTGMRRRFSARLISGTLIKSGYLYISEYDGKDYAAVFVTGELERLQAIKDLGKLSEFLNFSDTIQVSNSASVSPAAAANTLWANVKHLKPSGAPYIPSISLRLLWDAILTQMGIQSQPLPTEVQGVRIIPNAPNGIDGSFEFMQMITDYNQPSATTPAQPFNTIGYDGTIFEQTEKIITTRRLNKTLDYKVAEFTPRTNIKITIPNDWDNNLYLYSFRDGEFLGDRSFTREVNADIVIVTGKSLRGRTIQIPTGTPFSIVHSGDYVNTQVSAMGATYYTFGWIFTGENYDRTFTLKVASVDKVVPVGDLCRLQDNLPECTIVELAKTIAALSGCVLNYTDAEGIIFDRLDFASWESRELARIEELGGVARTFADYAQRNVISFTHDEWQTESDYISRVYLIDNDNLEYEKELQEIPFCEGIELDNALYIEEEGKEFLLGTDTGEDELARVSLPTNAGLASICFASTQISCVVRMSLTEYNTITPNTMLTLRNLNYVWTTRSWQNNIAKFTLARI